METNSRYIVCESYKLLTCSQSDAIVYRKLELCVSTADIFLYLKDKMKTMIAVYLMSIGIGCVLAMPQPSTCVYFIVIYKIF